MKLAPLLLLAVAACGRSSPPVKPSNQAMDTTTYYIGTVEVSGPDGTPYGPATETVVQREVSPPRHLILETVLVQGQMSQTQLRQTDDPNVFTASDDGGTFSGTLTMIGEAWAWTGWDYEITMTAGGSITGHADLGAATIDTQKQYTAPDGNLQAVIVEHVHAVPYDQFVAKRVELTGS